MFEPIYNYLRNASRDGLDEIMGQLLVNFENFTQKEQTLLLLLLVEPHNLDIFGRFITEIKENQAGATLILHLLCHQYDTKLSQREGPRVLDLLLSFPEGREFILHFRSFFTRIGYYDLLSEAVAVDDLELLKHLLGEFDYDVNKVLESGFYIGGTFVTIAVASESYACLDHLLQIPGIQPNVPPTRTRYEGMTPLFIAVLRNDIGMVEYWLKRGVDPTLPLEIGPCKGYTPLHLAAKVGLESMVECLLQDHRVKEAVNEPLRSGNNEGITPIFIAATKNRAIVERLIVEGADYNAPLRTGASTGETPLFAAFADNCIEVAEFLIVEKKCDATAPLSSGQHKGVSPFTTAVINGSCELINLVLQDNEPRLSIQHTILNNGTPTSIFWAALVKHQARVVEMFLDYGFSVNEPLMSGEPYKIPPLIIAVREGHRDIVEILLDHGANPNVMLMEGPTVGTTPLYYACENNHIDMVRLLLSRGANPTRIILDKMTMVHFAINLCRANVLTCFMEHDFDFGAQLPREDNGLLKKQCYLVQRNDGAEVKQLKQCFASEIATMQNLLDSFQKLVHCDLRWDTIDGRHHLSIPANNRRVQLLWGMLGLEMEIVSLRKSQARILAAKINETLKKEHGSRFNALEKFSAAIKSLGQPKFQFATDRLVMKTSERNRGIFIKFFPFCVPCSEARDKIEILFQALTQFRDFKKSEQALKQFNDQLAKLSGCAKSVSKKFQITVSDEKIDFLFQNSAEAREFAFKVPQSEVNELNVSCSNLCVTAFSSPQSITPSSEVALKPMVDLVAFAIERDRVLRGIELFLSEETERERNRLWKRIENYYEEVSLLKGCGDIKREAQELKRKTSFFNLRLENGKQMVQTLKAENLVDCTQARAHELCSELSTLTLTLEREAQEIQEKFDALPDIDRIIEEPAPVIEPKAQALIVTTAKHRYFGKPRAPVAVVVAETPHFTPSIPKRSNDAIIATDVKDSSRRVIEDRKGYEGLIKILPKKTSNPEKPLRRTKTKNSAAKTGIKNQLDHISSLLHEANSANYSPELLNRGLYYHVLTLFIQMNQDDCGEFPVSIAKKLLEALSHSYDVALNGRGLLAFCNSFKTPDALMNATDLQISQLYRDYIDVPGFESGHFIKKKSEEYLNNFSEEVALLRQCQAIFDKHEEQAPLATHIHSMAKGCFLIIGECAARLFEVSPHYKVAVSWQVLHRMVKHPPKQLDFLAIKSRCVYLKENIKLLMLPSALRMSLNLKLNDIILACNASNKESCVSSFKSLANIFHQETRQPSSLQEGPLSILGKNFMELLQSIELLNQCRYCIRNTHKHQTDLIAEKDFAELNLTIDTDQVNEWTVLRLTRSFTRDNKKEGGNDLPLYPSQNLA